MPRRSPATSPRGDPRTTSTSPFRACLATVGCSPVSRYLNSFLHMEYSSHSAGNPWGIELLHIMYLRMNSHQWRGTFT
eukprot:10047397-Heterocapsa_arctica.AAC.1